MTARADGTVGGLPTFVAALFVLLFGAALTGYVTLWPQAPILEDDSPQYLEVARDLEDFRLDEVHDRTPGYPLLLVLTRSSEQPSRPLFVVSLILHFVSIWLLAAVLRSTGVPVAWLVVFCCVLLLPPYVETAAHVMTENLAQFTLVAGFASLVFWFQRRGATWLALAAAAFACCGLVRPVYQLIGIAMSACLFTASLSFPRTGVTYRDAFRATAAILIGAALLLGGLSYTNYQRFGFFRVTPSAGFHFSTKMMSFVERLPDEYAEVREILVRERDAQLVKRGGPHSGTQTIWSARPELSEATGLSYPELSDFLIRMNLTLIRKAPVEYLQEVARSMAGYWFPPADTLAGLNSTVARWLWAIVHGLVVAVFFLQVAVFGGVSVFDASNRIAGSPHASPRLITTPTQSIAYLLAGAIVLYTMVLSCAIDIGEVRQRRPTDALIVFMCFLGACVWMSSIAAERIPRGPAGPSGGPDHRLGLPQEASAGRR